MHTANIDITVGLSHYCDDLHHYYDALVCCIGPVFVRYPRAVRNGWYRAEEITIQRKPASHVERCVACAMLAFSSSSSSSSPPRWICSSAPDRQESDQSWS